jgi:hypothetical protein
MDINTFRKLKVGDRVSLRRQTRTVREVHKLNGNTYMIEYEEGDNSKIGDPQIKQLKLEN